jgi:DNA-binding response OmpR family regulator
MSRAASPTEQASSRHCDRFVANVAEPRFRKAALTSNRTGATSMSTARRILIVEDDEDLRDSLKDQLNLHDEFEVMTAETASKGMEAAKTDHYELVLFDVSLPDMDGREAVRLLRKSGFKTPIVMLTGKVSDADQILGLDAGANDYVTKPFKFPVLLARSCVSASRARTRFLPSDPIRSSRPPSSCSTKGATRYDSPKRRLRSSSISTGPAIA